MNEQYFFSTWPKTLYFYEKNNVTWFCAVMTCPHTPINICCSRGISCGHLADLRLGLLLVLVPTSYILPSLPTMWSWRTPITICVMYLYIVLCTGVHPCPACNSLHSFLSVLCTNKDCIIKTKQKKPQINLFFF